MEKIVDLVTEGKYDKLKDRIEGLVAKKVADKIEDKKKEYVEKVRQAKNK